jgi:glutathione S-transferase
VLNDGAVLIDSGAIVDYLDDCAGEERALVARQGKGRREVLQLVAYATGAMDKAVALVYERWFHPSACANADWIVRCKGQLRGALSVLEERANSGWLWGGRLSHADVAAGAMLGFLNLRLPEEFGAGIYPRLTEYSRRLEGLDAFIEARPSPDEVVPNKV